MLLISPNLYNVYSQFKQLENRGIFFFFFEVKDRSVIDKSKGIQCIYPIQADQKHFFFFEVKDRSVIDKSKRIQCIYLVQAAREQGRK